MRISGVTSTELFRGTASRPLQVVRVHLVNDGPAPVTAPDTVTVRVDGPGVSTPEPEPVTGLGPGEERIAEVAVEVAAPAQPGSVREVSAAVLGADGSVAAELPGEVRVADTGWVMWMVC